MFRTISRARLHLLVLGALLAFAPELAAQRLAHRGVGEPIPVNAPIRLGFQTEDDFVTPLSNGQSISTSDEFGRLVSISSTGANAGAAIFDSTPGGPNDPCQDLDLLVGLGNVLILQNSQVPTQATPGFFDRPNDDQDGGELVFDFETPVEAVSIVLIDIDAGTQQSSRVTLFDESGRMRVYIVPSRWTRDLVADGAPGFGNLSLETLDPQPGFLSIATATQTPGFDAVHVARLVVRLGSSGAVDDLEWRPGRAIGMVADDTHGDVVVFDADHDVVLGTVSLPPASLGGNVGDCAIDARRGLGYVTDSRGHVWVIELALSPPQIAAGINPILVQNAADLSLSPNGQFLAVSGSLTSAPLSIVDLSTRTEVGTLVTGFEFVSADFSSNEALFGVSRLADQVVGASLSGSGTPSLNGDTLAMLEPNNGVCAPGGRVGVAVSGFPPRLLSFQVHGLVPVSSRSLSDFAFSACFSPDGLRLFVRKFNEVLAWSVDPLGGSLSAGPLYSIPIQPTAAFSSTDQIAIHPDGSRLYVPVPMGVRIFDPADGSLLHTISMPGLRFLTGIAVERGLR